MSRKQILLIEDDRFLADIYARHLRDAGFEVMHASNGEEGLEMAKKEPPSLILLGVLLPKKNGFEILEELKKDPSTKTIPIMMLTHLGAREDIERCLSLGACQYLIKSHHSLEEIVKHVQTQLATSAV